MELDSRGWLLIALALVLLAVGLATAYWPAAPHVIATTSCTTSTLTSTGAGAPSFFKCAEAG